MLQLNLFFISIKFIDVHKDAHINSLMNYFSPFDLKLFNAKLNTFLKVTTKLYDH